MTATGAPAASIAQLEANEVVTVVGTVVNPAGLTHAKTVPIHRVNAFAEPGLGASPVWHGFAIDQTGIAFTKDIGVVGDERIRIDLSALRVLNDGIAWAPGNFYDQNGEPVAACSRGTLARVEARLAEAGLAAMIGHEIEFVLVGPDGAALPADLWAQYGLAGVLEHEEFIRDVTAAAASAGVSIEQFHPEYGKNQFELSLRPRTPVAAADHLVLTRVILGRVARRHGMRVSLSPVPFAGAVGSGAHQHFSLTRAEVPLFSGGTGPHGMTAEGAAAIGGLLAGLPQAQAILSGSILSGLRMQPGHWSGAYVCWGAENREAAVRFLTGGAANPHGANVEVKIVDPSANPYYASAAILGLALDGIRRDAPLPPETTVDPDTLSEADRAAAGTVRLPDAQPDILAALDGSSLMREILGDPAVAVSLAVRRLEQEQHHALTPAELAARFRLAWSL
ncbi:type I glutamate--ammonia ligase [Mycolicibacterium palauense]|uniref:glutamine synthetase family protein n=1 Tax=Mycolicibacterium palauense TaxID=2034511 RepID=UPI000BFF100F|nr:glutamine synthetase family protein [Mycolicibacterium palauense]